MTPCPTCNRPLLHDRKDTSYASGTTYDRDHYRCTSCETWVTVEVPQKVKNK